MLQNILACLAMVKRHTRADRVVITYDAGGCLLMRAEFDSCKFKYQRAFNSNNWLTIKDEENDVADFMECTLDKLKHYRWLSNEKLDTRPDNIEADTQG